MTEAEWLEVTNPAPLLTGANRSERRVRLFACACCRHIWEELTQTARGAVAVAEQYADGEASNAIRQAAFRSLAVEGNGEYLDEENGRPFWAFVSGLDFARVAVALALSAGNDLLCDSMDGRRIIGGGTEEMPSSECLLLCSQNAATTAAVKMMNERVAKSGKTARVWNRIVRTATRAVDGYWSRETPNGEELAREYRAHADLGRDIFGNPFRPITWTPEWRTGTVLALAVGMYESRDFSAMPILADALQDAGCDRADVLDHCRGPGPHVRGCWVVDLVLGKE